MKKTPCGRGPGGFTLIEMLVVMILMIILLLFAVPAVQTTMRQGKLRAAANDTASLMRLARLESIRRSCQTIVRIRENPDLVEGFTDCDDDGKADDDKPTLGRFPLASGVHLLAPPDLEGEASIEGFSDDPEGGDASVAIFRPDGSIEDVGGFRFGDDLGNFLEVRVSPAATARITLYKCRVCTNADNSADWYAQGAGGEAWTWK